MAEAAWRVQLRHRVVRAEGRLRAADGDEGLRRVDAFFRMPVHPEAAAQGAAAWTHALRVKLDLAMESLMEVAQNLNTAVVYLEAAGILAIYGGNVYPSVPVPPPSILDVYLQEAALATAQFRLKASLDNAKAACLLVRWCRGHLSTAIALVDNFGILDVATLFRREHKSAYDVLGIAIKRTQDALREVASALQFLTP